MKKFKVLSLFSLLVICAFSFFACSKNDVKTISFANQAVQMYVDDYYDIAPIVAPTNIKDLKLKYTTSDDNVAIVTPENKVFARGIGNAVITATAKNGVKGYLSVTVQEKQTKLATPYNLRYNQISKRVEWDAVQNASSYTVFYGEKQETVALTYWTGFAEAEDISVKVRANGTGKYANSDQTSACAFKVLAAPTNVVFEKHYSAQENIIRWKRNGGTKFKIKIGDVSFGPYETETDPAVYAGLDFTNAGEYNISVISVGDGTIFDSRPSEPVTVKKLDNVSNINYVSTTKILSWDFVEGANYKVSIDGATEQSLTDNNMITNMSRGNHQISVRSVSGEANVINSSIPCVKVISVWETLNTPIINSYNESSNSISLSNVGLATDFLVTVNGENQNFTQNSEHNIITFASNVFSTAGDYTISVKSKGNNGELLHESGEATYSVKRLPAVSGLKIELGSTIHWNTNANVTQYKVVLSDGTTSEKYSNYASTDYNVFSRNAGVHTITVQYKGNGNNLLDGAETSLNFKKLATPTFVFDRANQCIIMSGISDHDFGVSVNGGIITSSTTSCDISDKLVAGTNNVFVYQVPKNGEIRSNDSQSQSIYVASQVENLAHQLTTDSYSYLSFNTLAQGDIQIMVDGAVCGFSVVNQSNGEYRTKLTDNTLFSFAKEYTISVGLVSSNASYVNSPKASIKVTKLSAPTNVAFTPATQTLTFIDLQNVNNYQIILDGTVVDTVNEKSYVFESLELGPHTFAVKIIGNNTTTISSDASTPISFTKTQQLAAPVLSFNKETKKLTITTTDESTQKYDVYNGETRIIEDQAKNGAGNVCDLSIDDAGDHIVCVIAKNDNEYILNGQQSITIKKLATPTNIAFDLSNNVVGWNAVAGTTKYKYKTANASEPLEATTNSFSTSGFNVGEYYVSVQATSSDVNTIDGNWSDETSLQIKKALSAPSNLAYSKTSELLTFNAVENATKYTLAINDDYLTDITSTPEETEISYGLPVSTFLDAKKYKVSVVAKNEGSFYQQSSASSVEVVKLDQPTAINISESEVITVDFNKNMVANATIYINGDPTKTSLSGTSGDITIHVILNGKDDYVVNSDEKVFTRTRLTTPTGISVSGKTINWTKNDNAIGYKISISHLNILYTPAMLVGADNNSYTYSFDDAGEYLVSVQAIGNRTTHLSSFVSSDVTFTKLAAPTNLSLNETEACVLTFEADGSNIIGYNVYIGDTLVVASDRTETEQITIPNDVGDLNKAGNHAIKVESLGNNSQNTISSGRSTIFNTIRLAAVSNVKLSGQGILTWTALPQTTSYQYELRKADDSSIKDGTTDACEVDLSTFIPADYEGVLKAYVVALGNNSTLLKSTVAFDSYNKIKKPTLSATSEKLSATVSDGYSCYVSVKTGGEYIVSKADMPNGEYVFPTSWAAGEYTFEVYATKDDEVNSPNATLSLTKLPAPSNVAFSRSGKNIVLSSDTVTGASNYRIDIDGQRKQTISTPQYTLATNGSIPVGERIFGVVAIGVDGTSINSAPATKTATKLSNEFLYLINDDYQASWIGVEQSGFSTYEIYVNGENKPDQTETILNLDSYAGGTITLGVRAVGLLSDNFLDSDILYGEFVKSITPSLSVNGTSVIIDNYQINDNYEITILKEGAEVRKFNYSLNSYVVDQSFEAGNYVFQVRRIQSEKVISSIGTITHSKLNAPTELALSRSEINKDEIRLNWTAPEKANYGYKIYVDDTLLSTVDVTNYLLTSEVPAGAHTLKVYAVGDASTGFDSNFATLSVFKIPNTFALRNEDGVLTWNQSAGLNILNYKIDVNNAETVLDEISTQSTSNPLQDIFGQLSIKIKAVGDVSNNTIDSEYSSVLSTTKLDKPTSLTTESGELVFNTIANADSYLFVVAGKEYEYAEGQTVASCLNDLTPSTIYSGQLKAKAVNCLNSDLSESISFVILDNPSNNSNATYISANENATKYSYNFATVLNVSKYRVYVNYLGGEAPISGIHEIDASPYVITDNYSQAGDYNISVCRVGGTGLVGGIHYFSSQKSNAISFTILQTPQLQMIDGVLNWGVIDGATKYYVYNSDSIIATTIETSFDFSGLFNDDTSTQSINSHIRAVGYSETSHGTDNYYVSSNVSDLFNIVKPRPPAMFHLSGGGLKFNTEGDVYTYYPSEHNEILVEFLRGTDIVASKEIAVEYFLEGSAWPYGDNYLEKFIKDLKPGDYTIRIKQIGDDINVLTTEYQQEVKPITVCPTPTNVVVKKDDNNSTRHILTWTEVSSSDVPGLGDVTYIVYVFDTMKQDWICLAEVNTNELDVTNTYGLLKPSYSQIAVAVKGNDENDTHRYLTGSMGGKINITVLGQVSALQTKEGYLTWGVIDSAIDYKILSDGLSNWFTVENSATPQTLCDDFGDGNHTIIVTALGNGSSAYGNCIINGKPSEGRTFNKLAQPVVTLNDENYVDLHPAMQCWTANENAEGYEVSYKKEGEGTFKTVLISDNFYESTVTDTGVYTYNIRAIGNTIAPDENGNGAYISSRESEGKNLSRYAQIGGVQVSNGVLTWSKPGSDVSPKKYCLDFVRKSEAINNEKTSIIVRGEERFDIGNNLLPGVYDLTIREISSSQYYISGLHSASKTIKLLDCPQNIKVVNGELVWDAVEGANYNLYLNELMISTGFESINNGAQLKYVSNGIEPGEYIVKIKAISTAENVVNSACANNNGMICDTNPDDWVIKKIQALNESEIYLVVIDNTPYVEWQYEELKAESLLENPHPSGFPSSLKYQVRLDRSGVIEIVDQVNSVFEVDPTLTRIMIKTLAQDTDANFFASDFSLEKSITKPKGISGLTFDSTSQSFKWDVPVDDENRVITDVLFIVSYCKFEYQSDYEAALELDTVTFSNSSNLIVEVVENNRFDPMGIGYYVISVQVQRQGMISTDIGISDYSDLLGGHFNLFEDGDGTVDNPFVVNSNNIHKISYRNNDCFILGEDLIFSGAPIGVFANSIIPFEGEFNGNGKTITVGFADTSFDSYYIGLFAKLGKGAKVHNFSVNAKTININNSNNIGSVYYVGFVAGSIDGDGACVENVKIDSDEEHGYKVTRSGSSETYLGGVAGEVINGTISNCLNAEGAMLDITTHYSLYGGIAGKLGGEDAFVKNCGNTANILGATNAAGIVAVNNGSVEYCFNTGAISAILFSKENNSLDGIAGGIVAFNKASGSDTKANVIACYNHGAVSATYINNIYSVTAIAGGVVGKTVGGKVSACYNVGSVSFEGSGVAQSVIGVISEYNEDSQNYYLSVDGLGQTGSNTYITFTSFNADDMKLASFVTLLNDTAGKTVYEERNGDYPKLSFEGTWVWA